MLSLFSTSLPPTSLLFGTFGTLLAGLQAFFLHTVSSPRFSQQLKIEELKKRKEGESLRLTGKNPLLTSEELCDWKCRNCTLEAHFWSNSFLLVQLDIAFFSLGIICASILFHGGKKQEQTFSKNENSEKNIWEEKKRYRKARAKDYARDQMFSYLPNNVSDFESGHFMARKFYTKTNNVRDWSLFFSLVLQGMKWQVGKAQTLAQTLSSDKKCYSVSLKKLEFLVSFFA